MEGTQLKATQKDACFSPCLLYPRRWNEEPSNRLWGFRAPQEDRLSAFSKRGSETRRVSRIPHFLGVSINVKWVLSFWSQQKRFGCHDHIWVLFRDSPNVERVRNGKIDLEDYSVGISRPRTTPF